MGTFTSNGKEYQQPAVPAEFAHGTTRAKAWTRGWSRAIWMNGPVFKRYKTVSLQLAFEAGFRAAREQRRAAGEQVQG